MKRPGWIRFKNVLNAAFVFALAMSIWTVVFLLMAVWTHDEQRWFVGALYLVVAAITAWHAVKQFRWHNYVDDVGPEAPPD
jgi:hypothetical protein